MSQPVAIPYDSPGAVRYEVDPDGTLHITIPAQGLGYFGIKSSTGRVVFLAFLLCCTVAPFTVISILWWWQRNPELLPPLLATLFITPVMLLLLWLAITAITQERIWIDATSNGMIIRRQLFSQPAQRTLPRDHVRAITLVRETQDMHWVIRVEGRFESEILLSNRPEGELRQIAARLREVLAVPERP